MTPLTCGSVVMTLPACRLETTSALLGGGAVVSDGAGRPGAARPFASGCIAVTRLGRGQHRAQQVDVFGGQVACVADDRPHVSRRGVRGERGLAGAVSAEYGIGKLAGTGVVLGQRGFSRRAKTAPIRLEGLH